MPELTDAQKVMRNDTGQNIAEQIRLLRLQIEGGGLPAGGAAEMIPVKASAANYDVDWQYPQYSRPNLLDNGNFLNPVNQRGQTSWQNVGEYTVDRWKLTSGSASLGASGLTLNGTLTQTLETAIGQPVIGSALLSDGSMISPTYNDSTKTFSITATGQTIKAVKLEIGSYQTLAHNEGTEETPDWVLNELPDYGEELAKCQRYQQLIGNVALRPLFFGFAANASRAQVQLDLPVSMAGTLAVEVLSTVTLTIRRGTTVGGINNVTVGNVRVYPDATNTHLLLDFNNLSISNLTPHELLCCAMTSGSFIIYSQI